MLKPARHVRPMGRALIVSLVLLCTASGTAVGQDGTGEFVVLGDSLSDTGNGFVLVGTSSTPPDYSLSQFLVPGAPYARGGHHFSNGATWIEHLARPLGLSRSVDPAFRSESPYAMNFAIATVRARHDGINPSVALLAATFLQRSGGIAPSGALYVVQVGGNDVRDALAAQAAGQNPLPILQAAAAAIASNIAALHAAGARQFLVWNVPDIGKTPAVRILDSQIPGAADGATLLTQIFNGLLAAALAPVSALPGIDIVPFDAFGLITAIVGNPALFGLTNVTDPCVTPDEPPFFCDRPDDYLFWDGIHPTKAAHAIVALTVAQLLGL